MGCRISWPRAQREKRAEKDPELGGSRVTPPGSCPQLAGTRAPEKGAGKVLLMMGCRYWLVGTLTQEVSFCFPSWCHHVLRTSSVQSITHDTFMPWEPWRVRKTALSTLEANCSRGLGWSREARTAGKGERGSPQLQLMEEGTSHNHHQ